MNGTPVGKDRGLSYTMNVLDVPMIENDAQATTIREYLQLLLITLWKEEECFSGKRPFGNSCWQSDIYNSLYNAGLISGSLDEDGWLFEFNQEEADELILSAIRQLK